MLYWLKKRYLLRQGYKYLPEFKLWKVNDIYVFDNIVRNTSYTKCHYSLWKPACKLIPIFNSDNYTILKFYAPQNYTNEILETIGCKLLYGHCDLLKLTTKLLN